MAQDAAEKSVPESAFSKRVSRRHFMKTTGAEAVGAAIVHSPIPDRGEGPENYGLAQDKESELKNLGNTVLMVDTSEVMVKKWVDLALGKADSLTERMARAADPENRGWYRIMDKFSRHGDEVASVMQHLWTRLGFEAEVVFESNDQLVDVSKVKRSTDELANPSIQLELDGHTLGDLVMKHPNQKIVNLSLLLGQIHLIQETVRKEIDFDLVPPISSNEGLIIPSQYEGERVEQIGGKFVTEKSKLTIEGFTERQWRNYMEMHFTKESVLKQPELKIDTGDGEAMTDRQSEMRRLCNQFPNTFFVFAAGNWGEDWTGFDNRPDNCLVVSWLENGSALGGTKGADVYVNLNAGGWDIPGASSFGTALISGISEVLVEKKSVIPEDLRNWFLQRTEMMEELPVFVVNQKLEEQLQDHGVPRSTTQVGI